MQKRIRRVIIFTRRYWPVLGLLLDIVRSLML